MDVSALLFIVRRDQCTKIAYCDQTEQFQKVLDAFASHKKLKRDELVLTYNDNYVYPQTTPAGIGMSDIGINYMSKSSFSLFNQTMLYSNQKWPVCNRCISKIKL